MRRFSKALFSLLVVCVLMVIPPSMKTAEALAEDSPLELETLEHATMGSIDMIDLPITTSPETANFGVSCGMLEMCGQDPCLCGPVDHWGVCACNGTTAVKPTITAFCEGNAQVYLWEISGKYYLATLGSGGSATVTIRAELDHHVTAEQQIAVTVAPFGILDALKALFGIAVVLGVIAVIVVITRFALRALLIRKKTE